MKSAPAAKIAKPTGDRTSTDEAARRQTRNKKTARKVYRPVECPPMRSNKYPTAKEAVAPSSNEARRARNATMATVTSIRVTDNRDVSPALLPPTAAPARGPLRWRTSWLSPCTGGIAAARGGRRKNQHFFQLGHIHRRDYIGGLKHSVRLPVDPHDPAHHQPRRVDPIGTGGENQISVAQVLGAERVFQTELVTASPTRRGRPRSRPLNFDPQLAVRIGNQHHVGVPPGSTVNSTHDAVGCDHRHPPTDTIGFAAVDSQRNQRAHRIDAHHPRRNFWTRIAFGVAEHPLQANVLCPSFLELHQPGAQPLVLLLKHLVVAANAAQRRVVAPSLSSTLDGPVQSALQWRSHRQHRAVDPVRVASLSTGNQETRKGIGQQHRHDQELSIPLIGRKHAWFQPGRESLTS